MDHVTWSSFVSPRSGRQMLKRTDPLGHSVITYCPADWADPAFGRVVERLSFGLLMTECIIALQKGGREVTAPLR